MIRIKETRGPLNKLSLRPFAFFILLLIPTFVLSLTHRSSDFFMHPMVLFSFLLAMLFASVVEIPIIYDLQTRKPALSAAEADLLGNIYSVPVRAELQTGKERVYNSTVALNLGGFVLPLLISSYLIASFYFSAQELQLRSFIIILIVTAVITHLFSEIKNGVGICVPEYASLLPIPLALLISDKPAAVIFASGTLGIFIGMVTTLGAMRREEKGSAFFSFGGTGNFNAIYIVSILSVLVSFLPS